MSSINFKHTPYGDLAIISMRGCEDISSQVDFYLKQWRGIEDAHTITLSDFQFLFFSCEPNTYWHRRSKGRSSPFGSRS